MRRRNFVPSVGMLEGRIALDGATPYDDSQAVQDALTALAGIQDPDPDPGPMDSQLSSGPEWTTATPVPIGPIDPLTDNGIPIISPTTVTVDDIANAYPGLVPSQPVPDDPYPELLPPIDGTVLDTSQPVTDDPLA